MEAVANSVDDALIDSLSLKLSNSASYLTDRKSVTFWPSGSNIYITNAGTKVIRFVSTNDNWLDPSTVRVMFNLHNTNTDPAKRLRTISGAWSFFRRMRIMCQGTLIEDSDYNRTCEMFEVLTSVHNRDNLKTLDIGQIPLHQPMHTQLILFLESLVDLTKQLV